ncbi:3D-(3,5/4)-trihydroxycyclohexane-1,2-dione hydrolase [Dickeya solani]|nr:3D-(3,5/4)-trihydroxycyclohexane-1,2-dione hydrolase [Dickeya solani]
MSALINAMRVLTDPADTGTVTLCLPQDVQAEAWDYPAAFFQRRVHHLERRPPDAARLAQAAALLARKRRPLLICGGGVRYAGAHDVFQQFAERFNLPFGETQAGKGALVSTHPLNAGGIGVTGGQAANRLAAQADLVIGVGTRLTDFTTASKSLFTHPQVEFLLLNVAEFDAFKLDATALIADAREGLTQLAQMLDAQGYRSGWGKKSHRRVSTGNRSVSGCSPGVTKTDRGWKSPGIWTRNWRSTAKRLAPG